MIGVCLHGGGAKGAYQAGVAYALLERGIEFDVISGTSIGAINGYYLYSGNGKKLKGLWTKFNDNTFNIKIYMKNVIENIFLIMMLKFLKVTKCKKDFYVNYVCIRNQKAREKIVNVRKLRYKNRLKAIRYSSLLPFRVNKFISLNQIYKDFSTRDAFKNFREDIECGVYDGYNLDGGILNNDLIEPFLDIKVDKLFIISLFKDYTINPQLLQKYDREDIIVIKPEFEDHPSDTLNFTRKFCKELFYKGYEDGKKVRLDIF